MAVINWRDAVEQKMPTWLREKYGERFVGLIALFADFSSQALEEAFRAAWLAEDTSPDDILPLVGAERNMPQYPSETAAQYRTRLLDAWDAWEKAGTEQALLDQLNALGVGAEIYTNAEMLREPVLHPITGTTWWSRFWVVLTSAPGFGAGTTFNSGATFGDGTLFGISGDPDVISAIRAIILKWKAAHEYAGGVIVTTGGILFGTGRTFNDGATFGGTNTVFEVY